jgi:hypothetical protein
MVPAAALIVIVILWWGKREEEPEKQPFNPPVAVNIQPIGFGTVDSILAGGSRAFLAGDYEEAARLLSRAHFFIRTGISEGEIDSFPQNLELFLGLSQFYRGVRERGAEYLESEVENYPRSDPPRWYLALIYLETGKTEEAREQLERVAALGGLHSTAARELLGKI